MQTLELVRVNYSLETDNRLCALCGRTILFHTAIYNSRSKDYYHMLCVSREVLDGLISEDMERRS